MELNILIFNRNYQIRTLVVTRDCTLCFIIHVLYGKKSNIFISIDRSLITTTHFKDIGNMKLLSKTFLIWWMYDRIIELFISTLKNQKRVPDWYEKLQFSLFLWYWLLRVNCNREIPRNNYKIIFFILWIFSCILFMTSIFLPWKACKTTFCWPCFNLNTRVYCYQL